MTVYFSILSERSIMGNPFRSFTKLCVRAGELGYKLITLPTKMRTDIARDEIVKEFRRLSTDKNDVLVMLDCDHILRTDLLEKLVESDVPVVTALAFRSNPTEPFPCFWLKNEKGELYTPRTWERGLIEAEIVGSGAIAIKRWVFDTLTEAGYDDIYFFYQYQYGGKRTSDEIGFSQMLSEVKIPKYVDTRIVIPHWVEAEIDEESWNMWCADNPIKETAERKTSVIIPQKGRLDKLETAVRSLFSTAPDVECILVIDPDDEESIKKCMELKEEFPLTFVMQSGTPVEKWNEGARFATGDILMLAANDCEFTFGWLEEGLKGFDAIGEGVVGTCDGYTDTRFHSPHYLVSRSWLKKYYGNKLCCHLYKMQFIDVEIADVATKQGKYFAAFNSRVIHKHPLTNSAGEDEIHKEGFRKYYDEDRELYIRRKEMGFPITWS